MHRRWRILGIGMALLTGAFGGCQSTDMGSPEAGEAALLAAPEGPPSANAPPVAGDPPDYAGTQSVEDAKEAGAAAAREAQMAALIQETKQFQTTVSSLRDEPAAVGESVSAGRTGEDYARAIEEALSSRSQPAEPTSGPLRSPDESPIPPAPTAAPAQAPAPATHPPPSALPAPVAPQAASPAPAAAPTPPQASPQAPPPERPKGLIAVKELYHKTSDEVLRFLREQFPDWVVKGHVAKVEGKGRSIVIFGERRIGPPTR